MNFKKVFIFKLTFFLGLHAAVPRSFAQSTQLPSNPPVNNPIPTNPTNPTAPTIIDTQGLVNALTGLSSKLDSLNGTAQQFSGTVSSLIPLGEQALVKWDSSNQIFQDFLPKVDKGIDAVKDGVQEIHKGLETVDKHATNFQKIGEQAVNEWGKTNESAGKFADTFTDPARAAVLVASAAAGAVVGATVAKWALAGVEMIGRSLWALMMKSPSKKEKEEELMKDFAHATEHYKQALDIALLLDKHIEQFLNLLGSIKKLTQEEAKDLDQDQVVSALEIWMAQLKITNERIQVKRDRLAPQLAEDEDVGDTAQCLLRYDITVSKNQRKLEKMTQLRDVVNNGQKYLSPCGVLKDFYKGLTKAESMLEQYRTQMLEAEPVWIERFYKDREETAQSMNNVLENDAVSETRGITLAKKYAKMSKEAFISGIQKEINTCMEETEELFKKTYKDGPIHWKKEFADLVTKARVDFGYPEEKKVHMRKTDDFSRLSWGEWAIGKSIMRDYCEKKVYNTPYVYSYEGFEIKIPRLEYFNAQLALIQTGQSAKENHYEKIRRIKGHHATSLLPDIHLNQESELARLDHHFTQILNDQTCYKDPGNCEEVSRARITHSQKRKLAIEAICGRIF